MSLIELKNYMMQVRIATLPNLCQVFKQDAVMVKCLLSHWIKKGKIRQCGNADNCASKCQGCPAQSIERYEWVYNY